MKGIDYMKTKREFENMFEDFGEMTNGKIGNEFVMAVFLFMSKHNFQYFVVSTLCRSEEGQILFITDHPLNNNGIIFLELFDVRSAAYVGEKKEVKERIAAHKSAYNLF